MLEEAAGCRVTMLGGSPEVGASGVVPTACGLALSRACGDDSGVEGDCFWRNLSFKKDRLIQQGEPRF